MFNPSRRFTVADIEKEAGVAAQQQWLSQHAAAERAAAAAEEKKDFTKE